MLSNVDCGLRQVISVACFTVVVPAALMLMLTGCVAVKEVRHERRGTHKGGVAKALRTREMLATALQLVDPRNWPG
jgi:hypothetical protein